MKVKPAIATVWILAASSSYALALSDCPGNPACTADLDNDGSVGASDLGILLAKWGPAEPGACGELTGDSAVDAFDLAELLRNWGLCEFECQVDIDVDTNRDNDITAADELDEDKWTRDRGALFLVNCDDDDQDKKSDSAEYDRLEQSVIVDDSINIGDAGDITPIVIGPVGDLAVHSIWLKVGSLEQIRAIHVFETIAEGTTAFWGGPTETRLEIDISGFVSETESTTLGIEGLKYRLVANGVAGFTQSMLFDGFVQIEVECRDLLDQVNDSDKVLLKVAPWIGQPNTLASEVVIARETATKVPVFAGGVWGLAAVPNEKFLEDLAAGLPAGQLTTFTTDTQWAQDDVEIGFSRTPGSEMRVAAYTRHHESDEDPIPVIPPPGTIGDAAWRRDLLMGPNAIASDIGIYRNPRKDDSSGDYGGNIEVMPPTAAHPLGRICVGTTISAKKKQFFESQEVQPPFVVDTDWLAVGHVDEAVTFWKENPLTVIVASPKLAYDILGFGGGFPAPAPVSERGPDGNPELDPVPDWATLFSIGETAQGIATGGSPNTLVDANANFLSPPIPWRFVRIYDGTGAGQIAHIVEILDANTLLLGTVWNELDVTEPISASVDADIPPAAARSNAIAYFAPSQSTWHDGMVPDRSSAYVVVEDTHWWEAPSIPLAGLVFPLNKTPATITKKEFDPNRVIGAKIKKLNIDAQARINTMRAQIKAAAGATPVTFVEVPVLYTGKLNAADKIQSRTAVAFTPGAANIQIANGNLFVAAQKGPRFRLPAGGESKPLDAVIQANLGNGVFFVEDWDHYHVLSGEVHCGTNVLRKTFPFAWWTKQPASVPSLP